MFGKHEPTVDIGGRQYTIAQLKEAYLEVVKDYNQLHDRYAALQRRQEQLAQQVTRQLEEQQPFAAAGGTERSRRRVGRRHDPLYPTGVKRPIIG